MFWVRCSSLNYEGKNKAFNVKPFLAIPGPRKPRNMQPFLLRTMMEHKKTGLHNCLEWGGIASRASMRNFTVDGNAMHHPCAPLHLPIPTGRFRSDHAFVM